MEKIRKFIVSLICRLCDYENDKRINSTFFKISPNKKEAIKWEEKKINFCNVLTSLSRSLFDS